MQGQVLALLGRAKAYGEVPEAVRAQIAADTTKVAAYLADKPWLAPSREEDPDVADSPERAVLHELVHAVDFPQFVAALIAGVFQAIVNASIQQMHAYAELVASAVKVVDAFLETEDCDEDGDEKKQQAAAAARPLARQRQQQLATMVLMGINRIVVTDG